MICFSHPSGSSRKKYSLFFGPDRRRAIPEILRFQTPSIQMMFKLPSEKSGRGQPLLARGLGRSCHDP
jgi:hypothetical protein